MTVNNLKLCLGDSFSTNNSVQFMRWGANME